MSVDIKVPVFPESVTDGLLTTWHKSPGDTIHHGEVIADIETDKVIFEVPSSVDGIVDAILVEEGATVKDGEVIARIVPQNITSQDITEQNSTPTQQPASTETQQQAQTQETTPLITPSANKIINEKNIDSTQVKASGKGGRILKEDVLSYLQQDNTNNKPLDQTLKPDGPRAQKRVPMTRLRARIAERLVEAQQTAAILTTFNEVNMQPVMTLRKKYREAFEQAHSVRLGFTSIFVKAVTEALKRFPGINASIEGDDIVYHGFFDIGIAVGSPRGLVVPIIRNAEQMSIADIERSINDLAERAKTGSLSLEEITGGTFSITNGGVFGSLLSTPILNPPQSGILGMHKIQPRPVVEDDQIVIRPMMYLAFSYDHRIIDGQEAVTFLVTLKDFLEDPAKMLLDI